ncbi:EKC/KEOPS complex subunit Pcc1p [[Candida] jaroonii]|uniref:EKC/KEOPS complex subunit Pcc1p n=1 Tax=[Candida] jaroonii TaxID=467808 RepID=A0ACA9YEW4_9ASCO|nr:EKC/KEOPS complex subunit Pcc1p [[Candida] jaroonii]
MSLDYKLKISIPFENNNQAEIAGNSLRPDPILKADEMTVDFSTDNEKLICYFQGVSDRVIRVAVSNVLDNIKTIIECIEQFEG